MVSDLGGRYSGARELLLVLDANMVYLEQTLLWTYEKMNFRRKFLVGDNDCVGGLRYLTSHARFSAKS